MEVGFRIMVRALACAIIVSALVAMQQAPAYAANSCSAIASPSTEVAPIASFSSDSGIVSNFNNARQAEGCSVALSLPSGYDSMTPAHQMFALFNLERTDRTEPRSTTHIPALSLDTTLMSQIDLNHSREMAQYAYFNHPSPINDPQPEYPDNVFNRLILNPAIGNTWNYVGENIAGGQSTAAEAVYSYMYQDSVEAWGHRHNILGYADPYGTGATFGWFNWVGVGVATGGPYGYYYSSDFLQASGYTPPASADTTAPTLNQPQYDASLGTWKATDVQDTGSAGTNVKGVTGVVFYVAPFNGTTTIGKQISAGVWEPQTALSVPSGSVVRAVAVDGSGNYYDCAANAASCGSSPPSPSPLGPIALAQGWNLLGIPTTNYPSASSLASNVQQQNAGLTVNAVVTYSNGRFSLFVPDYSTNLPLHPQQGVFVLTDSSGTWTPQGSPATGPSSITLSAGWNLVSIGYPGSLQASSVCTEISSANPSCQEVAGYSGSWHVYARTGGSDFSLNRDQGFMVLVSTGGSWTPA